MNNVYRLLISCSDKKGLVAIISAKIAKIGGNIVEAHQYVDIANKMFFIRIEIEANSLPCAFDEFRDTFIKFAKTHNMQLKITDANKLKRILILGSKSSHCVADLLHRNHENKLQGKIVGIISNHNKLAKLSSWYNMPFKYIPVNKKTKDKDLQQTFIASKEFNPDVIVLARYMQIIPTNMCKFYKNSIINIHHSFLPSFVGANPYQRAANRGVKLIGATCHYITNKLDDGAIIEQGTIRVSHHHNAGIMEENGQDIEKITLAKGLQYHLQDRIFIHNNKTIIFS